MEISFPSECGVRFERRELVATGGHGAVYRARDRARGVDVAVKLLRAGHDEDAARRLVSEARIASALSHPGIVRVIDAGEGAGAPWIAYELVHGPSLRERLAGGPLPIEEVLEIGAQVADALAHAHSRGVLHRDVKPDNVIAGDAGSYKLVDFGIAKAETRREMRTRTGIIVGTPAYVSPEQIRGEGASTRSDLYALGILLYELVTGSVPFARDTPLALLHAHLEEAPLRPGARRDGVPRSLEHVILALLEKRPEDRPESAEVVRDALLAPAETVLALPRAAPTARIASAPRTCNSGLYRATAAAWLLAALALGAALHSLGTRPERAPVRGVTVEARATVSM